MDDNEYTIIEDEEYTIIDDEPKAELPKAYTIILRSPICDTKKYNELVMEYLTRHRK